MELRDVIKSTEKGEAFSCLSFPILYVSGCHLSQVVKEELRSRRPPGTQQRE